MLGVSQCVVPMYVVIWLCDAPVSCVAMPPLQVSKVWPIKGGLLIERKVAADLLTSDVSQE